MIIYISNLGFTVTDEQLGKIFTPYGMIDSAKVIVDKFTSRSRGFGFVEMKDEAEAQKAIDALNRSQYEGKVLAVNKARPKNSL